MVLTQWMVLGCKYDPTERGTLPTRWKYGVEGSIAEERRYSFGLRLEKMGEKKYRRLQDY